MTNRCCEERPDPVVFGPCPHCTKLVRETVKSRFDFTLAD